MEKREKLSEEQRRAQFEDAQLEIKILNGKVSRRDEYIKAIRRSLALDRLTIKMTEPQENVKSISFQYVQDMEGNRVMDLQDELSRLQSDLQEKANRLEYLQKRLDSQQEMRKKFYNELEKRDFYLKDVQRQFTKEKDYLQFSNSQKEYQIERLTKELDATRESERKLRKETSDKSTTIKELSDSVHKLRKESESFKLALDHKHEELLKLHQLAASVRENAIDVKAENADLKTKYEKLVKDLDALVADGGKMERHRNSVYNAGPGNSRKRSKLGPRQGIAKMDMSEVLQAVDASIEQKKQEFLDKGWQGGARGGGGIREGNEDDEDSENSVEAEEGDEDPNVAAAKRHQHAGKARDRVLQRRLQRTQEQTQEKDRLLFEQQARQLEQVASVEEKCQKLQSELQSLQFEMDTERQKKRMQEMETSIKEAERQKLLSQVDDISKTVVQLKTDVAEKEDERRMLEKANADLHNKYLDLQLAMEKALKEAAEWRYLQPITIAESDKVIEVSKSPKPDGALVVDGTEASNSNTGLSRKESPIVRIEPASPGHLLEEGVEDEDEDDVEVATVFSVEPLFLQSGIIEEEPSHSNRFPATNSTGRPLDEISTNNSRTLKDRQEAAINASQLESGFGVNNMGSHANDEADAEYGGIGDFSQAVVVEIDWTPDFLPEATHEVEFEGSQKAALVLNESDEHSAQSHLASAVTNEESLEGLEVACEDGKLDEVEDFDQILVDSRSQNLSVDRQTQANILIPGTDASCQTLEDESEFPTEDHLLMMFRGLQALCRHHVPEKSFAVLTPTDFGKGSADPARLPTRFPVHDGMAKPQEIEQTLKKIIGFFNDVNNLRNRFAYSVSRRQTWNTLNSRMVIRCIDLMVQTLAFVVSQGDAKDKVHNSEATSWEEWQEQIDKMEEDFVAMGLTDFDKAESWLALLRSPPTTSPKRTPTSPKSRRETFGTARPSSSSQHDRYMNRSATGSRKSPGIPPDIGVDEYLELAESMAREGNGSPTAFMANANVSRPQTTSAVGSRNPSREGGPSTSMSREPMAEDDLEARVQQQYGTSDYLPLLEGNSSEWSRDANADKTVETSRKRESEGSAITELQGMLRKKVEFPTDPREYAPIQSDRLIGRASKIAQELGSLTNRDQSNAAAVVPRYERLHSAPNRRQQQWNNGNQDQQHQTVQQSPVRPVTGPNAPPRSSQSPRAANTRRSLELHVLQLSRPLGEPDDGDPTKPFNVQRQSSARYGNSKEKGAKPTGRPLSAGPTRASAANGRKAWPGDPKGNEDKFLVTHDGNDSPILANSRSSSPTSLYSISLKSATTLVTPVVTVAKVANYFEVEKDVRLHSKEISDGEKDSLFDTRNVKRVEFEAPAVSSSVVVNNADNAAPKTEPVLLVFEDNSYREKSISAVEQADVNLSLHLMDGAQTIAIPPGGSARGSLQIAGSSLKHGDVREKVTGSRYYM